MTNYDHKEIESKWIQYYLEHNLYATNIDPTKDRTKRFSIALPPPNVTGELHMGHALGGSIQDILIRYHRMLGHDVLWQIGLDHAGIGTQLVVEKFLKKEEGISKYELGRTKFLERVQEWKEQYGGKILGQMQKLAFSPDYARCRYTMDSAYSKSIHKVFVDYYKQGLVYRGERLVNWCPRCLTSLSDLELEQVSTKKKLYNIAYKVFIDGLESGTITVATSRPETMFGDMAVAVHPRDTRYQFLIDNIDKVQLEIPFVKRRIALVLDEQVKLDFGTGALKVTPAHDKNDEAIAKRQGLSYLSIFDVNAKLRTDDASIIPVKYQGLDRYKARELIIQDLSEISQLISVSDYLAEQDLHDRCSTEIEAYLSMQWYVKMPELAKLALDAVFKEQRIDFVPERYSESYKAWLENVQDWCISRQIWWGHRIPVFYYYYEENGQQKLYSFVSDDFEHNSDNLPCSNPEHLVDGKPIDLRPLIKAQQEAGEGVQIYWQDTDVLDTWFSSALWPFATMQDDPQVFEHFYPTSVLATAREIINLWVSRMIFSSEYFCKQEPFQKVLIHPVIQMPDGKRMSKSKGHVIDPLDLVDRYGADASRMFYASIGIYSHQDIRFPGKQDPETKLWSSDTVEQFRKFANKIFNAARFVQIQLGPDFKPSQDLDWASLAAPDIWLLAKSNQLAKELSLDFQNYDLSSIQSKIYDFIWFNFCDWYIEFFKSRSQETASGLEASKQVLYMVLEASLRFLHPIMPCITEELWQELTKPNKLSAEPSSARQQSISFAPYPSFDADLDNILSQSDNILSSKSVGFVIELISALRNTRQSLNIPWSQNLELHVDSSDNFERQAIETNSIYICSIAKVAEISFSSENLAKPLSVILLGKSRIQIPLAGLVDLDRLRANLQGKISKLDKDRAVLEQRLSSPSFLEKAAPAKIQELRDNLALLQQDRIIYEAELFALT